MKNLLTRKWFRRCCQVLLALFSLAVLMVASINWWGAKQRRDAIAALRSAGKPASLAEILADMPLENQNFAMIPLLKEALAQGRPPDAPPSPGNALDDLSSMSDPIFKDASRKARHGPGPAIDFSLLPAGNPYGQTAATFLAEYDLRNAGSIAQLREGLPRPLTRQPLVDAENPIQMMSMAFDIKVLQAITGLCLRAHAALLTGDPEKAADSLVIALRLAEVTGSKGLATPVFVGFTAVRKVQETFASGLREHVWNEAQLNRLHHAFSRMDIPDQISRAFDVESCIHLQLWSTWRQDRERYLMDSKGMPSGGKWDAVFARIKSTFPAGWFDLHGSRFAGMTHRYEKVARSSDPVTLWWRTAQEWEQESNRRGNLSKAFFPAPVDSAPGFILCRGAHAEVMLRMARLTCDLEIHRLRHGRYPTDLATLASQDAVDPINGNPFRYQTAGDRFHLYSVGPDGIDQGGKEQKKTGDIHRPDWVW